MQLFTVSKRGSGPGAVLANFRGVLIKMLARSLSAASCSRSTSCSLGLLLALAQPASNALTGCLLHW